MTRVSPTLVRADDIDDIDDWRDAVAQWRRLGGKSKICADLIASRLDRLPSARLSRRDEAVIAFAAARFQAPDRKQREAMASELSRYESGLWLRDRPVSIGGMIGADGPARARRAVLREGSINMLQTRQDDRPTFALKLYLDNPAYAKEEVLAGLERAAETIRLHGLVETDRIRDTSGRVLGSYRSYRL